MNCWLIKICQFLILPFVYLLPGPEDFAPIDRILTFSEEVTKVNVTVMVVDDQVSEGVERFMADLQLATSDAGVLIDPPATTILILDDDSMYYLY